MRVDAVYTGARFLTGADFQPAGALAVHHGRIIAVGGAAEDMDSHHRFDLAGTTVVPGFHDAHNHLAWYGMSLDELALGAAEMHSVADIYEAVAERATQQPPGSWIIGSGYDQNKLVGGHPHVAELDRAAPRHRVWLRHTSGHMCVVNSAVLAELALDYVPDGGDVVRDDAGRPTGLLREQAQLLLRPLVYPVPTDVIVRAIGRASDRLLAEGITSVQEAGIGGGWVGHSPVELAAYQDARAAGRLGVRATLMVTADVLHDVGDQVGAVREFGLDLGIRTGFGDDRLRIGAMKIFADGSLIGRTAAMHEDFDGGAGERGYFQLPLDELRETIRRAHLAGWQVATHAIGDRAVSEVVAAYGAVLTEHPRADHRHRIEHCGVTRPDDLERIADLGLIPVPQGRFVNELGDGMLAALGVERTQWCYRQRSFLDRGIVLPASSDRPVVDGRPLSGLQDLVERRTASGAAFAPQERLTPTQALRAYTYGSAHAAFLDDRLGVLAPGQLADFTVLSGDPLMVEHIGELRVLATVVGGHLRFDEAGFSGQAE